jgi:hypothetical protein
MKTRQEMVYDFMVAIVSNGAIWKSWDEVYEEPDDYGDCVINYAEALADRYLRSLG